MLTTSSLRLRPTRYSSQATIFAPLGCSLSLSLSACPRAGHHRCAHSRGWGAAICESFLCLSAAQGALTGAAPGGVQIEVKEGDTVTPGTVIAIITKGAAPPPPPPAAEKPKEAAGAPKSPPPPPPPSPKPAVAAPPLPSQGTKEGQLPPKDLERRVRAVVSQAGRHGMHRCIDALMWGGTLWQVPMTRLRKRVATRLKDAQNTFALLTTFNEVDM